MGIHRFDDFVKPAIQSILDQTFKEFEFIIVANGSEADFIIREIKNIFPNEERIVYFKTQIGQLAHALNVGIDAAKYDYIARMDADDIAYSDRLEIQLNYIQENSLDLVGTSAELINEKGEGIGFRKAVIGDKINKKLVFSCPFIHPTVMYKKDFVIKARGYNSGFNSEDYDLWLRMNRLNVSWDNMSTPLLKYRIHSSASQRQLLGYAETSGYALREFLLRKSLYNFFAIFYISLKGLFRSR